MKYEIPKEIYSKPKLMGLEMKELVILVMGLFLTFTMFTDSVHQAFTVPFTIVMVILLFWLVMPSSNNPTFKNYMSLFLLFKADKETYHAMDIHKEVNALLLEEEGNEDV